MGDVVLCGVGSQASLWRRDDCSGPTFVFGKGRCCGLYWSGQIGGSNLLRCGDRRAVPDSEVLSECRCCRMCGDGERSAWGCKICGSKATGGHCSGADDAGSCGEFEFASARRVTEPSGRCGCRSRDCHAR